MPNSVSAETVVTCTLLVANPKPENEATNVYRTGNVSIDVNSSCTNINFINISIRNTSGGALFYVNHTNVNNGTFRLNYTNLTAFTEYTWWVNASVTSVDNITTVNNSWYTFTTELVTDIDYERLRQIVREELDKYNAIKEGDNVNISIIETQFLIGILLLLFTIFMWMGYSIPEIETRGKGFHTLPFSGGLFVLFGGLVFTGFSLLILESYEIPIVGIFLVTIGIIVILYGILKAFFY